MSDHINHIKSHQVEIEMPRNAKQLVIGENSLEQSIETDIPVVMRFDSPLTNVSIVLKSRNNVTLLRSLYRESYKGTTRLTVHCSGLLY